MDYAASVHAINQTIFLDKDRLWFAIYNSYAVKHIIQLSNMQFTGFGCNLSQITSHYPAYSHFTNNINVKKVTSSSVVRFILKNTCSTSS